MLQKLFIFFILTAGFASSSAQTSPLLLNKCWEFGSDNMSSFRNASDNVSKIILPQNNSKIIALDKAGQIIWNSEISGDLQSDIFILKDTVYFTTQKPEQKNTVLIQGISLETGLNTFNKEVKYDSPIDSVKLFKIGDDLLFILNQTFFTLINPTENKLIAAGQIEPKISSAIDVSEKAIIFANEKNQVIEYSFYEKKSKVLLQSPTSINKVHLDQKGNLLIGDSLGRLNQFDKTSMKRKWTFRGGAEISSINETEDSYFLTSLDNYIYRITIKKGKLLWKRRLEARGETVLAKDNSQLISSIINNQSTLFLDLEQGRTSNQITVNDDTFFVTQSLIFDNLVVLTTNKSLIAYSFGICPK